MKSFKVSQGLKEGIQDVKSSQQIIDKVNEIHTGINENNLKIVNQHLVNHFKSVVCVEEQPNNPLLKIRIRSKSKISSMLQSQISQDQRFNELLMEKESQLNYYKNHVKQLTEELQKLTSLFETVKNENFNLKKLLEQSSNHHIIISNHQNQIYKLQHENLELENILKNTLLQLERQRFQLQSSKQSIIVKNTSYGQKLKLYDQNEKINRSHRSASFVPEIINQKSQRSNDRVKTQATNSTLPDSKAIEAYQKLIIGKENQKIKC